MAVEIKAKAFMLGKCVELSCSPISLYFSYSTSFSSLYQNEGIREEEQQSMERGLGLSVDRQLY
jgi:hypothetical protein